MKIINPLKYDHKMKKLINIISKAIDCPFMDTHNIPFEIADYLVHSIFYLQCQTELCSWRHLTTTGCFLATSKEHAWELYEEHFKDIDVTYTIKKDEFLKNLEDISYGTYLTTQGSIRHLKIEWIDERDDYFVTEYEYKKPTKNVNRKQIAESARQFNTWYDPMIDVMFDGVEYKPQKLNMLRRSAA